MSKTGSAAEDFWTDTLNASTVLCELELTTIRACKDLPTLTLLEQLPNTLAAIEKSRAAVRAFIAERAIATWPQSRSRSRGGPHRARREALGPHESVDCSGLVSLGMQGPQRRERSCIREKDSAV